MKKFSTFLLIILGVLLIIPYCAKCQETLSKIKVRHQPKWLSPGEYIELPCRSDTIPFWFKKLPSPNDPGFYFPEGRIPIDKDTVIYPNKIIFDTVVTGDPAWKKIFTKAPMDYMPRVTKKGNPEGIRILTEKDLPSLGKFKSTTEIKVFNDDDDKIQTLTKALKLIGVEIIDLEWNYEQGYHLYLLIRRE